MFRNPRENASSLIEIPLKPSTGRPPTPPNRTRTARQRSTMPSRSSTKPLTPRPNSQSNMASVNRQSTKQAMPAKAPVKNQGKAPSKPNASILNFFKKVNQHALVPQRILGLGHSHFRLSHLLECCVCSQWKSFFS